MCIDRLDHLRAEARYAPALPAVQSKGLRTTAHERSTSARAPAYLRGGRSASSLRRGWGAPAASADAGSPGRRWRPAGWDTSRGGPIVIRARDGKLVSCRPGCGTWSAALLAAYDNAGAESSLATLKKQLIHGRSWPTRRELAFAAF